MKNIAPWMLALLIVATVLPNAESPRTESSQSPVNGEEATEARRLKNLLEVLKEAQKEAPKKETPCRKVEGKEDKALPGWCGPVRALREFYGLGSGLDLDEDSMVRELVEAINREDIGYKPQFMIALVPDPLETTLPNYFDMALDAIRRGFGESQYRGDRFWLPWIDEADKRERVYLEAPGVLLFRRVEAKKEELLVVFLIGESPKAGIHQDAFREALRYVSVFTPLSTMPPAPVTVLGPSFSGSVDSLNLSLKDFRQQGGSQPFRIATGSATGSGLEDRLRSVGDVSFCRTVVPVDILQRRGFDFLEDELGWDRRRMALLVESDTGYGQATLSGKGKVILVPFPSPLSDIRNAWQQDGNTPRKDNEVEVGEKKISTGRPALDLSLLDSHKSVDVIPNFSSLTVPSQDLELSNLLETISREGIRYVGILATDVKDKLFLTEKIRQFAPDTVTFTFENNLVFAHPDYAESMDGTVVISSAPLFTEGAEWLPLSSADPARRRRQFTAEFQQGILEAVRHLLEPGIRRSRPEVWISAVGNGSLWPIAHLSPDAKPEDDFNFCAAAPAGHERANRSEEGDGSDDLRGLEALAGRTNLQLLIIGGLLCLLAWWLREEGVLKRSGANPTGERLLDFRLVLLAFLLLVLWAGVLLVLGSLPVWGRIVSLDWPRSPWSLPRYVLLGTLAVIYGFVILQMAQSLRGKVNPLEKIAWLAGGVVVLMGLMLAVVGFWMPGREVELFQLRARSFSSGYSPLVSLALLAGALYAWFLCELKRRWLFKRQATTCPLGELCESTAAGCDGFIQKIEELLQGIFPKKKWQWIFPAAVFLPAWFLLLWTVQPITEKKAYGQFFLTLAVVTTSLAALSFYRFVRIWWYTLQLLVRLDNASPEMESAFKKIAGELDWQPMKSFGLRMPSIQALILSARRLEGLHPQGFDLKPLREHMKGVFEAEANGNSGDELDHRRDLERIFQDACAALSQWREVKGVREFLALRIAAYLRYIFAHLRNSLLGGLLTGLLLLLSITAYAFEPKSFVSLAIWTGIVGAVALTLWIFLQMDRNPTLSRIGDTPVGEVTIDKTLLTNLFLYGGVPILGVIATQFPDIGRVLGHLVDPLLRVTGGG
jgi:hypothetical protein